MDHGTAPDATTARDVIGAAIAVVRCHPATEALGAALVADDRPYHRLMLTTVWARDVAHTVYHATEDGSIPRPVADLAAGLLGTAVLTSLGPALEDAVTDIVPALGRDGFGQQAAIMTAHFAEHNVPLCKMVPLLAAYAAWLGAVHRAYVRGDRAALVHLGAHGPYGHAEVAALVPAVAAVAAEVALLAAAPVAQQPVRHRRPPDLRPTPRVRRYVACLTAQAPPRLHPVTRAAR